MKTSCGIIIVNEQNEIFMGHSTGNKFYDIPKGLLDPGENELDCAIRECKEETSIEIAPSLLQDLGLFSYNKEKNLHLFITSIKKDDIHMNTLVCNSFFEDFYTKKLKPEVDEFKWVSIEKLTEHCAKSMGILLNKLKNDQKIVYQEKTVKLKI